MQIDKREEPEKNKQPDRADSSAADLSKNSFGSDPDATKKNAGALHMNTETRARDILNHYLEGRNSDFMSAGTAEVQAGLNEPLLNQIRSEIEKQIGKFDSEIGVDSFQVKDHYAFDFKLKHDQGSAVLRIVLTERGKMSGFWCIAVYPGSS